MKKIFSKFLSILISLNLVLSSYLPFMSPSIINAYDATELSPCNNSYPQCGGDIGRDPSRVYTIQPLCDSMGMVADYDVTDAGECPSYEAPAPTPEPATPEPVSTQLPEDSNPYWYCLGNTIIQVDPNGNEFEYEKCGANKCRSKNTPGYQSDAECYTPEPAATPAPETPAPTPAPTTAPEAPTITGWECGADDDIAFGQMLIWENYSDGNRKLNQVCGIGQLCQPTGVSDAECYDFVPQATTQPAEVSQDPGNDPSPSPAAESSTNEDTSVWSNQQNAIADYSSDEDYIQARKEAAWAAKREQAAEEVQQAIVETIDDVLVGAQEEISDTYGSAYEALIARRQQQQEANPSALLASIDEAEQVVQRSDEQYKQDLEAALNAPEEEKIKAMREALKLPEGGFDDEQVKTIFQQAAKDVGIGIEGDPDSFTISTDSTKSCNVSLLGNSVETPCGITDNLETITNTAVFIGDMPTQGLVTGFTKDVPGLAGKVIDQQGLMDVVAENQKQSGMQNRWNDNGMTLRVPPDSPYGGYIWTIIRVKELQDDVEKFPQDTLSPEEQQARKEYADNLTALWQSQQSGLEGAAAATAMVFSFGLAKPAGWVAKSAPVQAVWNPVKEFAAPVTQKAGSLWNNATSFVGGLFGKGSKEVVEEQGGKQIAEDLAARVAKDEEAAQKALTQARNEKEAAEEVVAVKREEAKLADEAVAKVEAENPAVVQEAEDKAAQARAELESAEQSLKVKQEAEGVAIETAADEKAKKEVTEQLLTEQGAPEAKVPEAIPQKEVPELSEADKTTIDQMLQEYGLDRDSIVYRVTPEQYIEGNVIKANPNSMALIRDPYNQIDNPAIKILEEEGLPPIDGLSPKVPGYGKATDLGQTLNVGSKAEVLMPYAKQGDVIVGIRVGDILDQGGKIYPDAGGMLADPLIFTIPEGQVKVVSKAVLDGKGSVETVSSMIPSNAAGGVFDRVKGFFSDETGSINLGNIFGKKAAQQAETKVATAGETAITKALDNGDSVFVSSGKAAEKIEKTGAIVTTVVNDSPAKLVSPEEVQKIIQRATEVEHVTTEVAGQKITAIRGIDPQGEGRLLFFLDPNQQISKEVVFIDKTGKVVDLAAAKAPIPLDNIKRVVVGGKEQRLLDDAWGNLVLYPERNFSKVDTAFKDTAEDLVNLWDTALHNPNQLDDLISNTLGRDARDQILSDINYAKTHPELRKLTFYDVNLDEFALWLRSNPEAHEDVINRMLKQLRKEDDFKQTGTFKDMLSVVEKLAKGENLSSEEQAFLSAFENRKVIFLKHIRDINEINEITDLTEGFVKANMAENMMVQRHVPEGVFSAHQTDMQRFAQLMEGQGEAVPKWFTPYTGNEFQYGVYGINGSNTWANAGGKYFIGAVKNDAEDMAQVITHERIHNITSATQDMRWAEGYRRKVDVPFSKLNINESTTESFRALARNLGDVDKALAESMNSNISYKTGVSELLEIIKEVNLSQNDRLLGTKLLYRGLTDIEDRETKEIISDNLWYLSRAYDKIAKEKGEATFAERMSQFSDGRMIRKENIVVPNQAKDFTAIKGALEAIPQAKITAVDPYVHAEFAKQRLESAVRNPEYLIYGFNGDIDNLFLETILANKAAQKELQVAVNQYYEAYVAALQKEIPKIDQAVQEALAEVRSNPQSAEKFVQNFTPVGSNVPNIPELSIWGRTQVVFNDVLGSIFKIFGRGGPTGSVKGVSTQVDQVQENTVTDIKTVELLAKKNLIKYKLQENGKATSADVEQIMAMDIIKSEVKDTGNGYSFTTGKTGSAEGNIAEGIYTVSVPTLAGIDISVPKVIKVVGGATAVAPIKVKQGSGKVETGQDTITTSKVSLAMVSEDGSKVLPWAGVNITLTKAIQEKDIALNNGWNLVTLAALPTKPITASGLLADISKQGGYATTVSVLDNGFWKSYVQRGGQAYSGDDFAIEPGKAYFVKAEKKSTFTFEGQNFVSPIKLKLASGWNAVGMPYTPKPYKASELIDTLNNSKLSSDTAARWESGLWDTLVKKQADPDLIGAEKYGEDFAIANNRGYLVKMEQGGEFSP